MTSQAQQEDTIVMEEDPEDLPKGKKIASKNVFNWEQIKLT